MSCIATMRLQLTPTLRELLQRVHNDVKQSQDMRDLVGARLAAGAAEWDLIKRAHRSVAAAGDSVQPLHQLCRGSNLTFPTPPRPSGKSPELVAHLTKLQRRLEQQAYDRMVHDVTANERAAEAQFEGGLQTYKQQMSFGVHVLVMMGTCYALGHLLGMALSRSRAGPPLVGMVLMFGVLALETILYVLRSGRPQMTMEEAKRAEAALAAEAAAKLQATSSNNRNTASTAAAKAAPAVVDAAHGQQGRWLRHPAATADSGRGQGGSISKKND